MSKEGPQVGPSKSQFIPNITDPMISAFERLIQRDIAHLEKRPCKFKHNLTLAERTALDSLRSDNSIIIKEADKGGAVVLMDREVYINEINKQLDDGDFYERITQDPGKQVKTLIQTVLLEATNLGYITETTAKTLNKQQFRTPIFYTLPKIHKPGFPPPGRPIISGCDSLLDPLSKYLDYYLQPLVLLIPSYLKDTQDLIQKVEGMTLPQEALIMTMDITSLYTNIVHTEAYRAISMFLDRREDLFPPTHFLLEILELILEKNYFRFGDQFYIQKRGIAMGSAAAPTIANLFMAVFEQEHIFVDSNPYLHNILFYKRYIDDLLIFYTQSDTAQEFVDWINSLDANIQFSGQFNSNTLPFLDVNVYRSNSN